MTYELVDHRGNPLGPSGGRTRAGDFGVSVSQQTSMPIGAPMNSGKDGTVTVFTQDGQPFEVSKRALKRENVRNVDPYTNPNAIIDTVAHAGEVVWVRPWRSLVILVGGFFGGLYFLSLVGSTLLIAAGRSQPVQWSDIDPTSPQQVGYWTASTVMAPAAQTVGNVAIEVAARTSGQPQATFVDDRRQVDSNLPFDSPLVNVSDQGRR